MLIIIIAIVLTVSISYFRIKPYLQGKPEGKTKLVRFLILSTLAISAYCIFEYVTFYSKPESFREGVELIKDNMQIMNKIGGYESYSYFLKDLPKQIDNPAFFKVSITGPSATIYLFCKVFKDKSDQWHIGEIKQDSLIQTR